MTRKIELIEKVKRWSCGIILLLDDPHVGLSPAHITAPESVTQNHNFLFTGFSQVLKTVSENIIRVSVESLESRYHSVSDHPRDSRVAESRKSSHHPVRRRPIPSQVFRHKFLKKLVKVSTNVQLSVDTQFFLIPKNKKVRIVFRKFTFFSELCKKFTTSSRISVRCEMRDEILVSDETLIGQMRDEISQMKY